MVQRWNGHIGCPHPRSEYLAALLLIQLPANASPTKPGAGPGQNQESLELQISHVGGRAQVLGTPLTASQGHYQGAEVTVNQLGVVLGHSKLSCHLQRQQHLV